MVPPAVPVHSGLDKMCTELPEETWTSSGPLGRIPGSHGQSGGAHPRGRSQGSLLAPQAAPRVNGIQDLCNITSSWASEPGMVATRLLGQQIDQTSGGRWDMLLKLAGMTNWVLGIIIVMCNLAILWPHMTKKHAVFSFKKNPELVKWAYSTIYLVTTLI